MVKCFICKNPLYLYIKLSNFQIYKCLNCGLGVTQHPIIQIGGYHRDDVYIVEENLFKNIFQKRVNLISKFISPAKALEVGCSTGLLLSLLKERGWDVTGVEISKKSSEQASQRGINIIQENFLSARINTGYDLLIFNHTLEHLLDPKKVIKKALTLLKKGGILYIDLPNFDSLSARMQKGSWPLLLPKEHLWHFTEQSLTKLLKESGFRVVYIDKSSGIWDYANPAKGVLISLFSFKKRFFNEILTALPSLIVSKLGLGSDLMVLSKK